FLRQIDLSTVGGQQSQQLGHYYENLANNLLNEGDIAKINTFLSTVSAFFSHPSWERKLIEARQIMDGVTENGVMSLAEFLETPQTEVVVTAMALTNRYLNRNLLMTASEETLRAIQLAPDYLPLHLRLADILLKQGHTDQAISKYLNIAKVYQMRGASDDAVEVYRKILRLAPMDVTVRTDLINSYIAHNKTEQALDEYLILANSYYQLAQVDKAIEKYNQALTLTNEVGNGEKWRADILGRMGDIYNQRFDWSNATSAYEELLKIRPNDENVQRKLIDFYFKQNKAAQAIRMLDKLMALYQRQNPLKTVDLLREFSTSRPDDMYLRQRMAIAYAQNGLTKEAIAEYDALGEMQLEKGMRDEAVQTIQAIINLGPDDLDGYKRLLNQIK
ncbi:MAG: tetratricopeptide repeat protein, partial [Anaerolineae bacterium]|nr:tetratricopeptide repeat protein [Anaerolineae bacterium]